MEELDVGEVQCGGGRPPGFSKVVCGSRVDFGAVRRGEGFVAVFWWVMELCKWRGRFQCAIKVCTRKSVCDMLQESRVR